MTRITNKHERNVFNILYKYEKNYKRLYRKPTQQLLNNRRDKESCIFIQPPVTNIQNRTYWGDFSILNKKMNIDLRIEVMSLETNGGLGEAPYKYLRLAKTMPEKEMILLLLGEGYDEFVLYGFKEMIKSERLPITIIRNIHRFENFISRMYFE